MGIEGSVGEMGGVGDLETRRRLTPHAAVGFAGIAQRWGLAPEDQRALLGGLDPATLFGREQEEEHGTPLPPDALTRVSLVLGIFERLERLFRRTPAEADAWVSRPNTDAPFHGQAPLAYMRAGGLPAMADVRRYVDEWAGGPPVREGRPAGEA